MKTVEQKMEQIREVFQAARNYCSSEKSIEAIGSYCGHAENEFRSIAYEAASMSIALRDFEENNELKNWKYFADEPARTHAAQVYAGLGWAMAQQSIPLDSLIENMPALLRYRVADGCGYYDGTFRNRQAVRNKQLPAYVSGKNLEAYFQGLGRSLWYVAKGDAEKANELLLSFDASRHAHMWRGLGTALTYVGGCGEDVLTEIKNFSGACFPMLACGVALAVRSRAQAGCLTNDAEQCSLFFWNCGAAELAQLTVAAECDDYFNWLSAIEKAL